MSNIIKPTSYIPLEDKKVIERYNVPIKNVDHAMNTADVDAALSEKDKILQDAELAAQEIIENGRMELEQLKQQAEKEIEAWWTEKRTQNDAVVKQARDEGYEIGYQEGIVQAKADVEADYEEKIHLGESILKEAYVLKKDIIQESEPFLIEMSTAIAEKIISKQIENSPSWFIDIVKDKLLRVREQGIITLCVSPENFNHVQDAKPELLLSISSQAELQILPDASVKDDGCIIRTDYGSMDARVTTQLNEIKEVLKRVAKQSEEHLHED